MRRNLIILLVLATMPLLAKAEERTAVLRQAQAADEIGAPLDRATTAASQRADSMRQFLRQIGRDRAFAESYKPATTPPGTGYRAMFDCQVDRVGKAGEERINPALRDVSDTQLFNEMAALQAYNFREFVQFSRALDESAAMRRYLESIGQWPAYESARAAATRATATKSAPAIGSDVAQQSANATPGAPAASPVAPPVRSPLAQSLPAPRSMDELAAAIDAGPAADDPVWQRKRDKLRNSVAGSMSAANVRVATDAAQSNAVAPSSGGNAMVDDPRFKPYYYGPTDGWNGWNDSFSNPFVFQNGGGVYKKSDVRVNRDRDPRLNGGSDRRVNIDTDRRLNIHEDPRENF
jgi:hypothetical protein